jgi:hypothetical protein
MVAKTIWDTSGMEGQRVRVTAVAMPPSIGIVVTSDRDTVTLRDVKNQTLIISKENITSIGVLEQKV